MRPYFASDDYSSQPAPIHVDFSHAGQRHHRTCVRICDSRQRNPRRATVAHAAPDPTDPRPQPERAATEYGYISPGEVISGQVRRVVTFVEKPDP